MHDEPWLSDEQQRVWRAFLRLNRALQERIERDMQQRAGIPHAYYLILAMLSEAPCRSLRMTDLAAATAGSPSRISHAVDRLVADGWVERRQVPDDRRGQLAVLTDAGFNRLAQAAPGHAETVRSVMFDSLSAAQLAAFGDVLDTLLTAGSGAQDSC